MNEERLKEINKLNHRLKKLQKQLDSLNDVTIHTNAGRVACQLFDENEYRQGASFNLSKTSVKIALTFCKEEIKIELKQLEEEFENA